MFAIQPEGIYLIHLLSSVLQDNQPPQPPESLDWERLYHLSSRHKVATMACYGINRLDSDNKPPQAVMRKFQVDCKKAVAIEATQHITVEQVLKIFEENQIASMPLKGYLIKYLYPQPDMRLMADVDILFKNEQTKTVKQLMLGLGFTVGEQGGEHDVYYKKPFMNLEMHRRLISEDSPYSHYLSRTWNRARLKSGSKFTYELALADFYIYTLIHLTKHYTHGGTGIRSFMDLYVYKGRYGNDMDWNYIQAELETIKLWEFEKSISGLNQVWFDKAPSNEFYDEMMNFILSSGAYGTINQALLSSISTTISDKRSIGAAKNLYRQTLFFPRLNTMKKSYPLLGTLPFLLPLCWVLRGLKCLLFKHKNTWQMINEVRSIAGEDLIELHNLHKKAGLWE